MDSSAANVLAVISLVVSVGGAALSVINHSRIRSACCGKKLEVSFDIDRTVPSPNKPEDLKIDIPK